jgi:predicted porin
MKKLTLVASMALAATGAAMAQSSVTLFGVVDAGLTLGNGSMTDRTSLTSGSNSSSRLGFRGTEDLGSGMAASFWLEAHLNVDNGTGAASNTNNQPSGAAPAGGQGLVFNRRSTVSLSGGWGEVRLGRDYTPQFWNTVGSDPFANVGVGTSLISSLNVLGSNSSRASNSIGYHLPSGLGGFYGQFQHFLGENASNLADDGTGTGVRLGYMAGPFNIAASTTRVKFATGNQQTSSVAGSWNFGVARVHAQVQRDRIDGATPDGRGHLLGVLAPLGRGTLKASYSRYSTNAPANPSSRKLAVGYVYDLSKRTALYTNVARVSNSGGATTALGGATTGTNQASTGLDLGIRHTF